MKLSAESIKSLTTRTKNRLALELDCSVQTIDRWIRENEGNGDLTKAAALKVIREETGLSDQEILEEETEEIKS